MRWQPPVAHAAVEPGDALARAQAPAPERARRVGGAGRRRAPADLVDPAVLAAVGVAADRSTNRPPPSRGAREQLPKSCRRSLPGLAARRARRGPCRRPPCSDGRRRSTFVARVETRLGVRAAVAEDDQLADLGRGRRGGRPHPHGQQRPRSAVPASRPRRHRVEHDGPAAQRRGCAACASRPAAASSSTARVRGAERPRRRSVRDLPSTRHPQAAAVGELAPDQRDRAAGEAQRRRSRRPRVGAHDRAAPGRGRAAAASSRVDSFHRPRSRSSTGSTSGSVTIDGPVAGAIDGGDAELVGAAGVAAEVHAA